MWKKAKETATNGENDQENDTKVQLMETYMIGSL